jgi:DegV family protein with EDD domain
MPVAVVTDSACDLRPTDAVAAGIRVVPLTVTFGDRSFRDGVDLAPEAFWHRVASETTFPTTASPSPAALADAYRAAAGEGADAVVSVHVSGKMSRTADTARLAAADAPVPVEVVDSGSVSMGQGLVALAAARSAAEGAPVARVATVARRAAAALVVAALLDTVDFLKRGGRVGRAKAALSELLRIRPVLTMEDGEPSLAARARTRGRAVDEMVSLTGLPAHDAALFHSGAPEVEEVAARLEAAWGLRPRVGWIGAVTGTHLGPRALGAAVLPRRGGDEAERRLG